MSKNAFKRIGLFAAAVAIVASMNFTAIAANGRIDGISGDRSLEEMYFLGQSGDFEDLKVQPGDEVRIPLTADMFSWSDGRSPLPMEAVHLSELRNGRVRVKTRVQANHKTLDYVQLDWDTFDGTPFRVSGQNRPTNRTAYISVMFAENLKSTEDIDFKIDIDLFIDGETYDDLNIQLFGTMLVDVVEVDKNTDYVNLAEGKVAEAKEYASRVCVDLGKGLKIYKNMHENNKYYATCDVVDSMDLLREEFPDIYSSIAAVYRLETIKMRYGLSEVEIKPTIVDPLPFYYAYGERMEYLGRTDELLPYSDVYILATKELDTFELGSYEDSLSRAPIQEREEEERVVWFDTSPDSEEEDEE